MQPDIDSGLMPEILQTQFVPPIKHVSADNPWLPLLTPHQLVEINSAFRKFDRDGDGHIEPKELRKVMADLGCPMSEENTRKLIEGVDTDGNGMIEFDEFIGIMAARMLKTEDDEELDQAFKLFDDGTGFISEDLLREKLCKQGSQRLTAADIDQMLGLLQKDAQGRVAFEHFRLADFWQVPVGHPSYGGRKRASKSPDEGANRTDAAAAGSSSTIPQSG